MQFQKLKDFILKKLRKELPVDLLYHSHKHTLYVEQAVKTLIKHDSLNEQEQLLLKTAAIMHDTGFLFQYQDNEGLAANLSAQVLPEYGFCQNDIMIVQRLIMATKLPQTPTCHLAEILCDADLYYLGTDEYHHIADLFRQELAARNTTFSGKAWLEMQINFLKNHSYFTQQARQLLESNKQKHLNELQIKYGSTVNECTN